MALAQSSSQRTAGAPPAGPGADTLIFNGNYNIMTRTLYPNCTWGNYPNLDGNRVVYTNISIPRAQTWNITTGGAGRISSSTNTRDPISARGHVMFNRSTDSSTYIKAYANNTQWKVWNAYYGHYDWDGYNAVRSVAGDATHIVYYNLTNGTSTTLNLPSAWYDTFSHPVCYGGSIYYGLGLAATGELTIWKHTPATGVNLKVCPAAGNLTTTTPVLSHLSCDGTTLLFTADAGDGGNPEVWWSVLATKAVTWYYSDANACLQLNHLGDLGYMVYNGNNILMELSTRTNYTLLATDQTATLYSVTHRMALNANGTVSVVYDNGFAANKRRMYLTLLMPITDPAAKFGIQIDGNAQFNASNGVSAGAGTAVDPYIIENLHYNGTWMGVPALYILNTRATFIIRNCSFEDSDTYGLQLYNVTNATVTNCTFEDDADRGAFLWYANGTSISWSNTTLCDAAFYVYYSDNCTFANNTIDNCSYGVHLVYSNTCDIRDSDLHDITIWDIGFQDSSYNLAYHNDLMDSVLLCYDDGVNVWLHNYWENYTGVDADNDGFGDTNHTNGIFDNGADPWTANDSAPAMRPYYQDAIAPTVISSNPTNGTVDVDVELHLLSVRFSEAVNVNVTLGTNVPVSAWSQSADQTWLNGTVPALSPDTDYYIYLDGNVTDTAGYGLYGIDNITFRTASLTNFGHSWGGYTLQNYSQDLFSVQMSRLGLSARYNGPNATHVRWTFGDGVGADGERAGHEYNESGFYNVTCYATLANGTVLKATRMVCARDDVLLLDQELPYGMRFTLWSTTLIAMGAVMLVTAYLSQSLKIKYLFFKWNTTELRMTLGALVLCAGLLLLSGAIQI